MRILYLSCHEILEYDELKMLTAIGHEVYSLGAYTMPGGQEGRKRPPLPQLPYDPHFIELATRYSKEELHPEMLEGMDTVIVMHVPEWLERNWDVFHPFIQRGGRVIWRSIGQSVPSVERRLNSFRYSGLEIVRYSPKEQTIDGYLGCDALIRFAKDPDEFKGYTGEKEEVINFTQSMMQRARFCGWEIAQRVLFEYPYKIYGPGNEDLGAKAGGLLSYEDQKKALRENRVYFYTGTYPASYTLSFMEAWMTGIPIVAVGPAYGNGTDFSMQSTYEIQDLIENGVDGFVSDNPLELKAYVRNLLHDPELAREIGARGREKAIALFGESVIMEQWKKYLSK